jgi:hypothetical protein
VGLTKIPKLYAFLQIVITFHLVLFSWIFFRANSFSDAFYIITHFFSNIAFNEKSIVLGMSGRVEFFIAVLSILCMAGVHIVQEYRGLRNLIDGKPTWVRWPVYYILIFSILLFGVFEKTAFIYFQF